MADLQAFKITPLASASVNVPRAQIEARVVDSTTQALIVDLTGPAALIFPAVLTTLSAADRLELAQLIAHWLIRRVAGVG